MTIRIDFLIGMIKLDKSKYNVKSRKFSTTFDFYRLTTQTVIFNMELIFILEKTPFCETPFFD
jgi:hypothetical protein